MRPTHDQFIPDVRDAVKRRLRRERFERVVHLGFIWFWCSWMSFGLWALAIGNPVVRGEDAWPWPLKLYLGIPVAAVFAGVVVFVGFGGIGWLRTHRK
ncbi:MAG: hypothetical protein ACJ74L_04690 [Gaiellaceae bacterium]